jgi:hypothetical protein
MYHPRFSKGAAIEILDGKALEEFARAWKYHHPIQPEQLAYAGRLSTVDESYMYHGGDILYRLVDVPGIWHECCLCSA